MEGGDQDDDDGQAANVDARGRSGIVVEHEDEDDEDYAPSSSSSSSHRFGAEAAKTAYNKRPEPGKIFTLRDAADEEGVGENEDDKGQAFYAGGSETSGQQILGPSKKNTDNIIKDLFKKAKE